MNLQLFENVAVQLLSRVPLSHPTHCSTTGFPVLHYLPEFAQTQAHWVKDYIQKPLHKCYFSEDREGWGSGKETKSKIWRIKLNEVKILNGIQLDITSWLATPVRNAKGEWSGSHYTGEGLISLCLTIPPFSLFRSIKWSFSDHSLYTKTLYCHMLSGITIQAHFMSGMHSQSWWYWRQRTSSCQLKAVPPHGNGVNRVVLAHVCQNSRFPI